MDDVVFDGVPVEILVKRKAKITEKLPLNSKVASSLALRVSWLKFEPRSRILPSNISQSGLCYCCYSREFFFLFLLDKNVSLNFVK